MKTQLRQKWSSAFTLIEIMVVVVILGILAATIIPQFIGTTQDAKVSAAKSTIAELESAVERFNIHLDRHPTTEEGLKVLVEAPSGDTDKKWRGPYIKMLRPDPWGNPYQYRAPGIHHPTSFDLWSRGAGGADGGEAELDEGVQLGTAAPQCTAAPNDSASSDLIDGGHRRPARRGRRTEVHRVRLDRKNGRYFIERTPREGEKGSGFVREREVPGGEGPIDTRISIEIRAAEDSSDAIEPTASSQGEVRRSDKRDDTISFYADGTAEAQEILLRDRQGFRVALRINPITSRVHITELERE